MSEGLDTTLIGLIGDTTELQEDQFQALEVVESVKRIKEPYKKANRSMHPDDTVIDVCGRKIGSGNFQVIAGPCSVDVYKRQDKSHCDHQSKQSDGSCLSQGSAGEMCIRDRYRTV